MKGYCGGKRPRNEYCVVGLVEGCLVVRGQGSIDEEVRISGLRKDYVYENWGRWSEEECLLG